MKNIIIAGTDTNVGKTICSALLMSVLKGTYFKPLQTGGKFDNDTKTVRKLSKLNDEHFLKEKYLLKEPFSPHKAAELDNLIVENEKLVLPDNIKFNPLIIELAGGLMVPVNDKTLMIDIVKEWSNHNDLSVVLCAKTTLGTINHTLLSIEALKSRNINIAGIVFVGEKDNDNIKTISQFSEIQEIGYIPIVDKINKRSLIEIFVKNFKMDYFGLNVNLALGVDKK